MADASPDTSEPKRLPADEATRECPANNQGKFYSSFLCKAAVVTVFLVFFPLFPSVAPEFIIPTSHAGSWELLQLILVGIAVSYGLFSKRNEETEKDRGGSKLDNAQSYVTKLLQVSSVFDDESEAQTVINQVETSSPNFVKLSPNFVKLSPNFVKSSPNFVKQQSCDYEISQEPLLLPVRSLKQRMAPDVNTLGLGDESGKKIGSIKNLSRSSSGSGKPRNLEIGGSSFEKMDDKLNEEDVVVLRSPIPWRSRSGRIQMQENDEIESNMIDESTSFKSQSNNNSSTPKKPSESRSESSEDDFARRKNYFSRSPPPAPPPPTASQLVRKSMLSKSNSVDKVFRRSTMSVSSQESSGRSDTEELPRCRSQNDVSDKSVRTYRSNELEKRSADCETKFRMETNDHDTDVIGSENGEAETTDNNNNNNNNNNSVNDVGLDVDKKADEFIAKFRNQIRLQRIDSIRRSTAPEPDRLP